MTPITLRPGLREAGLLLLLGLVLVLGGCASPGPGSTAGATSPASASSTAPNAPVSPSTGSPPAAQTSEAGSTALPALLKPDSSLGLQPPVDIWDRIRRGFAMPCLESELVRERE